MLKATKAVGTVQILHVTDHFFFSLEKVSNFGEFSIASLSMSPSILGEFFPDCPFLVINLFTAIRTFFTPCKRKILKEHAFITFIIYHL